MNVEKMKATWYIYILITYLVKLKTSILELDGGAARWLWGVALPDEEAIGR
jgi:hypothetical protein